MSKIFALSQAASIALHSMVIIAKTDGMINVTTIAERIGSSKHHVAKVLQRLVKNGFISSLRGPTGGFAIKKNLSKITFLEIFEAIEGQIQITVCPLEKGSCPFDGNCIIDNLTTKMEIEFREYLLSQTLDKYV